MMFRFYANLIILIIIHLTSQKTLKINPIIKAGQKLCMNHNLQLGDRYQFSAYSQIDQLFRISVGYSNGQNFVTVYNESTNSSPTLNSNKKKSFLRTNKISTIEGIYTFCIYSVDQREGIFNITFQTGESAIQITQLPDQTDSQKIDRQIDWVSEAMDQLDDSLRKIESLRTINEQFHGLIGIKMFIFGIIGLMIIFMVNILFYRGLKKQLKAKKMI